MYHPKFLGFEHALREKRERNSDAVKSTAFIPLPFPVQTHLDAKYNLGWARNSSRVVYVDLKAFVESYAVGNDQDDFEILE